MRRRAERLMGMAGMVAALLYLVAHDAQAHPVGMLLAWVVCCGCGLVLFLDPLTRLLTEGEGTE